MAFLFYAKGFLRAGLILRNVIESKRVIPLKANYFIAHHHRNG
jgi:hypothetical protein